MIRSDSKIGEDWERNIKIEGKDLERERERNKRGIVVQGDKVPVGVLKKNTLLHYLQLQKLGYVARISFSISQVESP